MEKSWKEENKRLQELFFKDQSEKKYGNVVDGMKNDLLEASVVIDEVATNSKGIISDQIRQSLKSISDYLYNVGSNKDFLTSSKKNDVYNDERDIKKIPKNTAICVKLKEWEFAPSISSFKWDPQKRRIMTSIEYPYQTFPISENYPLHTPDMKKEGWFDGKVFHALVAQQFILSKNFKNREKEFIRKDLSFDVKAFREILKETLKYKDNSGLRETIAHLEKYRIPYIVLGNDNIEDYTSICVVWDSVNIPLKNIEYWQGDYSQLDLLTKVFMKARRI